MGSTGQCASCFDPTSLPHDDNVEGEPEARVEDLLRLGRHAVLQGNGTKARVHGTCSSDGRETLRFSDVVVAEEKLAGEVGLFNDIIISHGELGLGACAHAHQREVFDELAAERP